MFPFGHKRQRIWAPARFAAALLRRQFQLAWRKIHFTTFFSLLDTTLQSCNSRHLSNICFQPREAAVRRDQMEVRARWSSETWWDVGNLVKIHTRLRVLRLLKYVCLYFISTQTQKLGHSRRQLKLNAIQFFTTFPLLNLGPLMPPPSSPFFFLFWGKDQ